VATIVGSAEDTVAVEYYRFSLVDAETPAEVPWPRPMANAADEAIVAIENRVDFQSVGEFHRAAVRMTAWDGEPDRPAEAWDDDYEVVFTSGSGRVMLCGVTSGCSPVVFEIGPARQAYGLRVYCAGRDRTLEADLSGSPIPAGPERYDLRFWPVRATEPAAG